MKNSASSDNQANEIASLLQRFHKKLNKVEQLMNASMRPLIRQDLYLSEEARSQALVTLERWSELYRHGLEASVKISERGEKWLLEASERLSLTVDELRKLDITNEAMATQKDAEKAKHFLEIVDKITRLIIPIADEVDAPIETKVLHIV